MQCVYIYRSEHKPGAYLFLPEKDNFEDVPDELKTLLGELCFSFEFSIDENRKLVRFDASEVLTGIKKDGFFLQLPPSKFIKTKTNTS